MDEKLAEEIGLHLHLEPRRPIQLQHLLLALESIGQRYRVFARENLEEGGKDAAKLYVSSIRPGSIDISLVPEMIEAGKHVVGVAVGAGLVERIDAVAKFAGSLRDLVAKFEKGPAPDTATIRECDHATNIVRPIAEAGGTQTFNVNNIAGDQVLVLAMDGNTAMRVFDNAVRTRDILQIPQAETRRSVALVWKTFDRSEAKRTGRSPDKGLIEEIDAAPHSVLFGEDEAGLKADILSGADNPMTTIYYVDAEVVRVDGRITAYRIIGYGGKDPMVEPDSQLLQ